MCNVCLEHHEANTDNSSASPYPRLVAAPPQSVLLPSPQANPILPALLMLEAESLTIHAQAYIPCNVTATIFLENFEPCPIHLVTQKYRIYCKAVSPLHEHQTTGHNRDT